MTPNLLDLPDAADTAPSGFVTGPLDAVARAGTSVRAPAGDLDHAARLAAVRQVLDNPTPQDRPGIAAGWLAAAAGFAALAALVFMVARPPLADAGPPALVAEEPAEIFLSRLSLIEAAPTLAPEAASDTGAFLPPPDTLVPEATEPFVPARVQGPALAPAGDASAAPSAIVALVIDDLGLDAAATARALALPAPVTLAFLPYAPGAGALGAAAHAAGHEVFVHVPMEPVGVADPGPGALTSWMSAEAVSAQLAASLDAAPYASGLNNHMGSRFTACAPCVARVAEEAALRGLTVLDSRTSARSVLEEAARAAGAVSLGRDVFIDNDRSPQAIARQLAEAEELALTRGWAVAIAHPYPETLSALETWIDAATARGIRVGSVRDLPAAAFAPADPRGPHAAFAQADASAPAG